MIRKALEKDLINVEGGYRELLIYEKEHGTNSNWVLDLYPTIETAKKAFLADTLYVLELEGKVCGSMILNQVQPEDYKDIDWEYKAEESKVFVIHTLCILPSMAKKGYGRKMMEYSENLAREMKCRVLRLETHAENEPAKALYKSLGFRFAGEGDALLAGVIPEKQVFYEKKL